MHDAGKAGRCNTWAATTRAAAAGSTATRAATSGAKGPRLCSCCG